MRRQFRHRPSVHQRMNMRHWPANLMTAGNLLCGVMAIIAAFDGHPLIAGWLIVFSAVLDAFDGKAARFFGGGSAFGLQFDSMADLISFGVAPAMLVYAVAFNDLGAPGLIVTSVPVLAGAFRLARFNVGARGGHHDFQGLSSPLHACLMASFVIMNYAHWGEIANSNVLAGLVLASSALMVSHIPMPGLPRFTFKELGYNLVKVLALLGCVVFMVTNPARNTFPTLALLVVVAFAVGTVRAITDRDSVGDATSQPDIDDEPETQTIRIGRGTQR